MSIYTPRIQKSALASHIVRIPCFLTNIVVHACENLLHVRNKGIDIYIHDSWILGRRIFPWADSFDYEAKRHGIDRSTGESNLDHSRTIPKLFKATIRIGLNIIRKSWNGRGVSICLCRKIWSWIVSGVLKVVRGKREGRERKRFEYPSDKECGPTIQIDKMYASTCFFFSLFFIVSKLLYLFLPSLFYVLDSTWWKGDTFITRVSNSIGRRLLPIIFRGWLFRHTSWIWNGIRDCYVEFYIRVVKFAKSAPTCQIDSSSRNSWSGRTRRRT